MVKYRIKGQHLAHQMHNEVITIWRQLIEGRHLRRQVAFTSYIGLGWLTGTADVFI